MGARSPAFEATFTNLASNGRPDDFPRAAGAMPREAIPVYCWAKLKREPTNPSAAAERTCRRVIALQLRISNSKVSRCWRKGECAERGALSYITLRL